MSYRIPIPVNPSQQIQSSCKSQKVPYDSEELALEANESFINSLPKKERRYHHPVKAYKCKCGKWHLTSKLHD